jgi:hypothetical protein
MLRKQQDQDELARDGWGSAAGDGSRTRTSSRVMDGDRPQATAAEEDVLTRMDAAEAAGRTTATLLARARARWVGIGAGGGGGGCARQDAAEAAGRTTAPPARSRARWMGIDGGGGGGGGRTN